MATNNIRSSKADPASKADGSSGITIDAGPYEAIVVKHVEGTRSGQLLVYIPDFGGLKTNPDDQILVSYCSPFYGKTYGTDSQTSDPTATDAQWSTGQSYGMWMVPPDIGNKVLVVFAAGSRDRGYWIGCIYDSISHQMVPALGRNVGSKTLPPTPDDGLPVNNSPVVEGYTGTKEAFNPDAIVSTPRYVHQYQNTVLVNQGLDRDKIRGAISSSSLREAPSNVYGISTPGRSVTTTPQTNSTIGEYSAQAVIARKGGHTFVMDDGDKNGVDQLIRLRTTNGHQILMNDTADVLYIASATGLQWLEFSNNGSINIYAKGGFNVRSESTINLHGDSGVNVSTPGILQLHGDSGVNITSSQNVKVNASSGITVAANGTLNLSAGGTATLAASGTLAMGSGSDINIDGSKLNLNSGSAPTPSVVLIEQNSLPDVTYDGTIWTFDSSQINTVCTVAPAHEPWTNNPGTANRPKG
jgi:Type VI secretion system/phage-baseplate injector OB domain